MKGLLKFITCGSVDDGKSTLIGHILYDAKLLYADQKKALELDSKVGSRDGKIDYSLLLDGLMAEREQGITIDVAYRYFTTDNRSFIVADTPGHEEYTRNMAVGASFADLAVILVDAKQGVLVQTRRHARICSLMGIEHFVFAVNKMDLIDYDEEKFKKIEEVINELSKELSLKDVKIIPLCATEGDNITTKSENIPWYHGEPLLTYLENVDVSDVDEEGFYMPVQRVCRPNHEFRGFQGQVECGEVKIGDELTTLPSNEKALVKSINIGEKEVERAFRGQPVTITLNKEVDVSRGCVLFKDAHIKSEKNIEATILWMDDSKLNNGQEFLAKIGTKLIPAVVSKIEYSIDVNTGEHKDSYELTKNEIAYCKIVLAEKVVVDRFNSHKTLGELILIDRVTNMTSACGVIEYVGENSERNTAFVNGKLHARGDIFEEFYYNMESLNITKYYDKKQKYSIGDEIPIKGESYEYPENFDILILRDNTAVKIRNKKVEEIIRLDKYIYGDYPITNGRGFKINVSSTDEFKEFIDEYNSSKKEKLQDEFFNKWMSFEAYRKIVFKNIY
ncbi:sulfate adenylyltransferase subunit 1 [uncultured Clostridium sp.]|uniref:sulfate adenylyltransferase subunit 1 n=1 Tax=uncultured Clostridium sp. TaxID=59620 RepID=UPI0025E00CA2|nr:GTP-binding protein [uncultured Clostridium sp.]